MTEQESTPPTMPAVEAYKAVANVMSLQTFYRRCVDGSIPAVKVGSLWLVLREPFERLLRGELPAGK